MAMMSYVHEVQTVYDVFQNPQMILLCEKGVHEDSARCEQIRMLLPQRSQGNTLKFICFSSPTPALLQAKQTLLALPTWPAPTKRPAAIGKP